MDRKRLLLALVLSVVVLMGYSLLMNRFFPPSPVSEPVATSSQDASSPKPATPAPVAATPAPRAIATAPGTPVPAMPVPPRDLVIETPYWNVTLTNRGAVATSWILKGYHEGGAFKSIEGAAGGALQLIPQPLPEGLDAPLALLLPDHPEVAESLNYPKEPATYYHIKMDGVDVSQDKIDIQQGEQRTITFSATSGATTAVKEFTFYGDRLVFDAKASVTGSDQPVQIVVGSGFGDQSDKGGGSYSTPPQIVMYTTDGSRQQLAGAKANPSSTASHTYQWAGVADHYFAMLAVPAQPVNGITPANVQAKPDPNQPAHDYPSVAVPASSELHIFVGPKGRELLAEVGDRIKANLGAVIDYGFFGAVVRPLIYPLAAAFNLLYGLFHNYGWAIVVVTVLINLAMWPLRASSSKKMKQAAKHQPRLKELQDRMKKLKENPKKYERELQQLQQEQLALMKEANPLGGCLPMLLQLPIFWSVYMYLSMSLDVRHAHWLGWINDLSKPDPFKILPIVMCVTMIASTKFTPQPASADPAMKMQRVMMTWLMPVMLTYFFFLSAPSGLVLYWMVSNMVGVGIQLLINKRNAEPEAGAVAGSSTASSRTPQPPTKPKGKAKAGKERTVLPSSDLS
ncbi:MAG: membrane protein insertase YidC [Blastocatellia bacterium]